MKSKLVLRLSGKASQVFTVFDLFVKQQGNKTLGQILKEKEVLDGNSNNANQA